jgi:hypothetical protein
MKYMLLIHHGDTQWERLSEDEQRAVAADYQAINQTPGVTPGVWMESPGWRRPSRSRTARRSQPTGHSWQSRRRSAATCSSRRTTSTPRSSSRRAFLPPGSAVRSRSAQSRRGSDSRAGVVNIVSHGFTVTDHNLARFSDDVRESVREKTPSGRLSMPDDIAGAVLRLGSPANGNISGAYLPVAGGMTEPRGRGSSPPSRTHRGGGTRSRPRFRCARAAPGRATGTCPRDRRARVSRPNTCGRRSCPRGRMRSSRALPA